LEKLLTMKEVDLNDICQRVTCILDSNGALLIAGDPPNAMTIGWGTIGPIWHRQVMTVMVRPTRFTFGLMEKARDFSVCLLPPERNDALGICGTRSGRDTDKVTICGFVMERCARIDGFYIAGSDLRIECRIIHKHRLDPATLDPEIVKQFYPKLDFHTVYYGEIMGVFSHH
jgi:flavin reductase (DIM6/NTAB) family NADH-FMN oxidoreductase RutF